VVGVNKFQQEEEHVAPTFRLDPALERAQVERLREVRAGRSQSAVAEKLAALQRAGRGSDNLMPPMLDAAGVYATVGEISDCLRAVFGEHREV
jgi:methylmalonyl-CoA mutase N-terminal domain/subunit